MNRDYYGYDTSQLPCRNREHSTYKDTNDSDHFTDFWWNVEEKSQYCVFQPCPHRNNQLGYSHPPEHWYSPIPEEANRVLDAHPDGVHLERTEGPADDRRLEGLRERIRQWKLFNEPRVPGGFGDEERSIVFSSYYIYRRPIDPQGFLVLYSCLLVCYATTSYDLYYFLSSHTNLLPSLHLLHVFDCPALH